MRTLTIEEALNQGLTPSFLRTVSRSLERIGRNGYGEDFPAYDPKGCFRSARNLRYVAKQLEKIL